MLLLLFLQKKAIDKSCDQRLNTDFTLSSCDKRYNFIYMRLYVMCVCVKNKKEGEK